MNTPQNAHAKTTMVVIKLSGKLLGDHAFVQDLCALAQRLTEQGCTLIVVHGGGQQVDQMLTALGQTSAKIDGLRVTTKAQIPTISGVLAGTINKQLVARMQQHGLRVCGLSLLDGDLIQARAHSNPALGQVAQVSKGDGELLQTLLRINITPVIASIAAIDGELYNVNADDAAVAIAHSVAAEHLLFVSDVEAVYDAQKNALTELTALSFTELKHSGVIHGGMIAKIDAAVAAATQMRKPVQLLGAHTLRRWIETGADLNGQSSSGTKVMPSD